MTVCSLWVSPGFANEYIEKSANGSMHKMESITALNHLTTLHEAGSYNVRHDAVSQGFRRFNIISRIESILFTIAIVRIATRTKPRVAL
jgi:hypothetical protein